MPHDPGLVQILAPAVPCMVCPRPAEGAAGGAGHRERGLPVIAAEESSERRDRYGAGAQG